MKKILFVVLLLSTLYLAACGGGAEPSWKIENKVADGDPAKVTYRNPFSIQISATGNATITTVDGGTDTLTAGTWQITSNFPLLVGNQTTTFIDSSEGGVTVIIDGNRYILSSELLIQP